MSRTLYLLGYQAPKEGELPVTDEMRLKYGFPTEPAALHNFATKIFQHQEPDAYKRGIDFAIKAVDIATETAQPQLIAPELPRPFVVKKSDRTLWSGFVDGLDLIRNAPIDVRVARELPAYDDLEQGNIFGNFILGHSTSEETRQVQIYTPDTISAIAEGDLYTQHDQIAALIVFRTVLH